MNCSLRKEIKHINVQASWKKTLIVDTYYMQFSKKTMERKFKVLFFSVNETIPHIFFDCYVAALVWRIVQVSFSIMPPLSIQHKFDDWVLGVDTKIKYKLLVELKLPPYVEQFGYVEMKWFFNNTRAFTPLWVIFRGIWPLLQKGEDRPQFIWGCRILETTTLEIFTNLSSFFFLFSKSGWSFFLEM